MTKVTGHLDRKIEFKNLDELSMLNVDADRRAKNLWNETKDAPIKEYLPIEYHWKISVEDVPVVSDIKNGIYDSIYEEIILSYYQDHGIIYKEYWEKIDWNSMEKAMINSTIARRLWFSKFVTNNCAVGTTMLKRKKRDSDECPRCGKVHEDNIHVIQCDDTQAKETWSEATISLLDYMYKLKTHDDVIQSITSCMTAWRDQRELPEFNDYSYDLQQALREQTEIGWNNFMFGRLS